MLHIRKSEDRGKGEHGWLSSRFSFSFADYHDPRFMGFRDLRVINEDVIAPGAGFPTHGHKDMEIITYILNGALEHKDSLGTGSIIHPGEIQKMSAGTGIRHSEYNPSAHEPTHLLQIWVVPAQTGLQPRYEQKTFSPAGPLTLLAAAHPHPDAVTVAQDMSLWRANPVPGETIEVPVAHNRFLWIQMARGALDVNGHMLEAGDGAALAAENGVRLTGGSPGGEALIFDLR